MANRTEAPEEGVATDPATVWLIPLVDNIMHYMKICLNECFGNGTNPPPHLLELRIRGLNFMRHPREDTFGEIIKYAENNKLQDPPFSKIGGAFTGPQLYTQALNNWNIIKTTYHSYFV